MSSTKELNTLNQKSDSKIDGLKPVRQNILMVALINRTEPIKPKSNSKNNPKAVVEPQANPKATDNLLAKSLDFGKTLVNSLAYSAYESPLLGLSQIVKATTNVNIEKYLPQVKAVKPDQFGTSKWYATQIGSGLGIALGFMLSDKLMGSKIGNLANTDLASSATGKIIGQSAVSGAIYEGVFSPSNLNAKNENLLTARLKQAFSGALTFGAMAGVSNGLSDLTSSLADKNILAKAVNNNLVNGIVSGSTGGLVNVNTDSLLNNGRLASLQNDIQTAYAYSVAGIPLGLAHVFLPEKPLNEKITPEPNDLTPISHVSLVSQAKADLTFLPEKIISDSNLNALSTSKITTQAFEHRVIDSTGKELAKFSFDIPQLKDVQLPDISKYNDKILFEKIATRDISETELQNLGLHVSHDDNFNIHIKHSNGVEVIHSDDKTSINLPDSSSVVIYDHHYMTYTGSEYYYPDGHQLIKYNDGTMLLIPPYSQTRLNLKPNNVLNYQVYSDGDNFYGSYEETHVNGHKIIKATLDSGSHVIKADNGVSVAHLKDGQIIITDHEKTVTLYPDGTQITKNSDNSLTNQNRQLENDQHFNQLINKITAKFNQDHFDATQYDSKLNQFSPEDRGLAKAILDLSLNNMTVHKLMQSMRINDGKLGFYTEKYVVKDASSPGNFLAYLYRKALGSDVSIISLDELDPKDFNQVLFFDDLSSLNKAELAKVNDYLEKTYYPNDHLDEQSAIKFRVFDSNNFTDGINVFDVVNNKVSEKLQTLVDRAKIIRNSLPNTDKLSDKELAYKLLNEKLDELAQTHYIPINRSSMGNIDNLLEPPVTNTSINEFITKTYKTYSERLRAAEFLANESEYFNLKLQLDQAKTLHRAINYRLMSESGQLKEKIPVFDSWTNNPQLDDLKYVVGLDNGSSAFINYLYRQANDIPNSNFLSKTQLMSLDLNSKSYRNLVILDDAVYSGTQMNQIMDKYFENSKNKLVLGLLGGSYKGFAKELYNAAADNPLLVTLESHIPIRSDTIENSIIGTINRSQGILRPDDINQIYSDLALRKIVNSDNSYKDINSYQIWPYMTPDTSIALIKKLGEKILNFK